MRSPPAPHHIAMGTSRVISTCLPFSLTFLVRQPWTVLQRGPGETRRRKSSLVLASRLARDWTRSDWGRLVDVESQGIVMAPWRLAAPARAMGPCVARRSSFQALSSSRRLIRPFLWPFFFSLPLGFGFATVNCLDSTAEKLGWPSPSGGGHPVLCGLGVSNIATQSPKND